MIITSSLVDSLDLTVTGTAQLPDRLAGRASLVGQQDMANRLWPLVR